MLKHVLICGGLLFASIAPAAAQSVFDDPQGTYRLQVPAGWEAQPQSSGVSLIRGQAYASFVHLTGEGPAEDLVEFFAKRVQGQWKQFEGASAGSARFGGMPGAYGWYKGINPRGVEAVMKIVATTSGGSGFALLMSAPRSEFPKVKADFEAIEAGFEPTR